MKRFVNASELIHRRSARNVRSYLTATQNEISLACRSVSSVTFNLDQCSKDLRAHYIRIDDRGAWIGRDLVVRILCERSRAIRIKWSFVIERPAVDSRCCGWRGEFLTT